ncbi:hypothetical protein [Streptomyces sp. NPDC058583]|uniref:hypothetical protein n=1 Tax=Streptomyces sp. NPDC058583 TaxID=3346549 RepID=UPI003668D1B7
MLACWFGVDRSTITRAIGEARPLLAERDRRRYRDHGPQARRRPKVSGEFNLRQTSRTPSSPWPSRMPAAGSCSVVQPSRQAVPTSPTCRRTALAPQSRTDECPQLMVRVLWLRARSRDRLCCRRSAVALAGCVSADLENGGQRWPVDCTGGMW